MFSPHPALPSRGRLLFYRLRGDHAPVAEAAALGIHASPGRARLAVPARDGPTWREQPVAEAPVADALDTLLAPRAASSPSVTGYVRASRLAVGLVAEHQVAPVLRRVDDDVVAAWQALLPVGSEAADALRALADALPATAHALALDDAGVWHPHALLRAFVDAVADVLLRTPAHTHAARGRPRARLLPWTARWEEAATDPADPRVPLGAERGEVLAGVREWLRPYEQRPVEHIPQLRLHPPDVPDGAWHLRFGLRERDGARIDAAQVWRDGGVDGDRVEALLGALARAARVSPAIEQALDEREPTHAVLDVAGAWRFIDQTAVLLTDAGYEVTLPEGVDDLLPRLRLGDPDDRVGADGGAVGVRWQGVVGGEVVGAGTVDDLLRTDEPLVFWEGRWVRVPPSTRAQWARRGDVATTVPLIEAIGLAMAGVGASASTAAVRDATQVSVVGPLARLVDRLRDAPRARDQAPPTGFVGTLRGYQRDAVAWLDMMRDLRLGAVLADDMGLGKTIMLIAHVLAHPWGPHLVVCPTSVVTNWEREVRRFAPDLPVQRHHGPDRAADLRDANGVVITSYGTLRRDIDVLAEVDWMVAALDEAQQVKNPETLGARAVRRLRSAHCVALTGTPVENRLRELWAVLDLTNPGLLGPRTGFEQRFAHPIERRGDHVARRQLRRLVAPFVLRRTKADPRVAPDLPPRIERTVPCAMTDEQRTLYATAVERFRDGTAAADGMHYRGAVLALLTRLKQICDDPRLVSDTGHPRVGRSGKLAVTHQLITEAAQAGERVLVFTQYVGMARILVRELSAALSTSIPLLHGGMSAEARQRVVDLFQGQADDEQPPVLVASLRAGGTGMNLTAATQVIHYDRWWNPAVEDQASDRAHRIGQTERVLIHRLVAVGTLEERIDALLEAKREMASAVVGAGETWITELERDALLELVALSDDTRAGAPTVTPGARDVPAGSGR